MKPENNTENTAGSDCQERLVSNSIRLAMLAHELQKWNEEVQAVEVFESFVDPLTADYKILNAILDLWGIPTENTPEDENDEEAWIDGVHYCRDMWIDIWEATVEARSDYRKFVEVVARIIPVPAMGWSSGELEFLFYPANADV